MDLQSILDELRAQERYHREELGKLQTAISVLRKLDPQPAKLPPVEPLLSNQGPPLTPTPPWELTHAGPATSAIQFQPESIPQSANVSDELAKSHREHQAKPETQALIRKLKRWRIRFPIASSYIESATAHGLTRQVLKNTLVRSPKWPGLAKDYQIKHISEVRTAAMITEMCAVAGIDYKRITLEVDALWREIKEKGKPGLDYIVRPDVETQL